jgi:hypothetical protein
MWCGTGTTPHVLPSSRPETPPENFAAVREAIRAHHRLRCFRAGQAKNQAFVVRHHSMTDYAFVQINPQDWINFLVVDVDHDDALERLLYPAVPQAHWIVINPVTGHGQAGWMIEPVYCGNDAAARPVAFAHAVQTALNNLVGGDEAFSRFLVRNPVATVPAGEVRFGTRATPYRLGELKAHMVEFVDPFEDMLADAPAAGVGAWDPRRTQPPTRTSLLSTPHDTGASSRNCQVFYATRRHLWNQHSTTGTAPDLDTALTYAHELNDRLPDPLSPREVREIAASAVRQVQQGKGRTRSQHSGETNPYLSQLGRRGGSTTTPAKIAAAQQNAKAATHARSTTANQLAGQAAELRKRGTTVRKIAELLQRCERTIRRYLTQADTTEATGTGLSPAASLQQVKARIVRLLDLLRTLPPAAACPPDLRPTARSQVARLRQRLHGRLRI